MSESNHWKLVLFGLVLTLPAMLVHAWALSLLWGWFVVPLGVRPVAYIHMLGISIFFHMLTHRYNAVDQERAERDFTAKERAVMAVTGVTGRMLGALIFAGFGWAIVSWFM